MADAGRARHRPVPASPLWNFLSKARFGFIAPGTSTFVVLGETGGTRSGIGYKITQDNGNLCGGYCAYDHDDDDNAFWLFDVNDILAADDVHLPRPYAFGHMVGAVRRRWGAFHHRRHVRPGDLDALPRARATPGRSGRTTGRR